MTYLTKKIQLLAIILTVSFLSANATGTKISVKPDELKRMSVFVSNFVELGLEDFDINTITSDELIEFGIWHNYKNNYRSRFTQCKDTECKYGGLVIDRKYIEESIKKYFAIDFSDHATVSSMRVSTHYDGKFYHISGADGDPLSVGRVKEVFRDNTGQLKMTGEIYSIGHDGEESEVWGTFEVYAKPYKYGGKNTWSIISFKSVFND